MHKTAAALVALASTTAFAQNIVRVTYSWTEVYAGTNTPVALSNGVLEPGEGARIQLTLTGLINGSNAIGQTIAYSGPGPGPGIVRGMSSFVYDLTGSGADAAGTWTTRTLSPFYTYGRDPGHILQNGAQVHSFGGGHFLLPGSTADGTNPVVAAWSGVWTPASYASRIVTFRASPSDTVPTGEHNAVWVQIGAERLDPQDPGTEYALYWPVYFQSSFGTGIGIPVSAAPVSSCYANCDGSTGTPRLTANDMMCFLSAFSTGQASANCDNSTMPPVLNANDIMCFLNKYAAGCT